MLWKKDTAPNTQDPRINALNDWMGITQTVNIFYTCNGYID